MVNVSVARRYARALLDAAGPQAEEVLKQLQGLVASMAQSTELADVVSNPAYSHAQRQAVVEKMLAMGGQVAPALHNVIKLLNDRSRLAFLPDIARVYRDLVDARLGRVRGTVTSASPLNNEQLKQMEQSLEKLTQRNVELEAKVDKALLGGATAQVGSVLYDGSLKNQLSVLAQQLKR